MKIFDRGDGGVPAPDPAGRLVWMNFVGMPELHWKYGYPAVILVSVGIVAALVIYFKKKKWL